MDYKNKDETKINILMNINSYYGEHEGRMAPMITFLLISSIPLFLYLIVFIGIIPLKYVLIFEVPFVIRVALKTLGKEDEKFKVYMATRQDEYANADDIVRIPVIQEDGLIEYENGKVAYIVSAFTTTYINEDELTGDLETFLSQLSEYEYDIHIHMVFDEYRLEDNLESMKVYTDKELMQERVDFYIYQDEQAVQKSELYRINFLVKGSKYQWKKLKRDLDTATKSMYAKVFKICYVCNKEQANDVMSRDLFMYVDLEDMMQKKYKSEEYFGSKVYYYGEEIPDKYKETKDTVDLEGRRVVEK